MNQSDTGCQTLDLDCRNEFVGHRINNLIFILSVSALSVGCAGPTTPFGAVALFQKHAADKEVPPAKLSDLTMPQLHLSPSRQVLHGPTTMNLTIDDPAGVPNRPNLKVSYNGLDVTRQFLAHAWRTEIGPDRKAIRFSTRHLRLLPDRENRIRITYQHDGKIVSTAYENPICSAFETTQMVFTVPDFEPSLAVLQSINRFSQAKNMNPYFVTALVAQESGFNPTAVSHSKAMGLTQITGLGEGEIIAHFNDWPRFPGVNDMPLPMLKLSVISGAINSSNEWRLDPIRSIEGGVEYLSYLGDYWNRPDKHAEVERVMGPSETAISEVILASYNSGAARVSDALSRSGAAWLADSELNQARTYVHRVVSYCDHFEHRED